MSLAIRSSHRFGVHSVFGMWQRHRFLFLGGIYCCLWGGSSGLAAEPVGVAVVELFTSEGCNSCPSADRVLLRLTESAAKTKTPVYCIGWHVDYWDRLGWPDRLADRRYTDRQRQYAQRMELRAVYTPQMVVNGTDEFVGSNTKLTSQSIGSALATPTTQRLELTLRRGKSAGSADIEFHVSPAAPGQDLQLVLVETGLKTDVKAGENSGETLIHANAARAWKTVRLSGDAQGKASLSLPAGTNEQAVRLIGFIQSPETLQISGAADAGWVGGVAGK